MSDNEFELRCPIASIYKRKQDQGKKHAPWYFGFSDEHGRRKTRKGFTEKAATQQLAAKVEHEVMLRKRGLIDSVEEKSLETRKRPVEEHLSEFQQALGRTGQNTEKHIRLTMTRIRNVLAQSCCATIADLSSESVEIAIDKQRQESGFGARTWNHYAQAIHSFGNWLAKTKKLPANPVVGVARLNTEVDVRRKRRALTDVEFGQLVNAARKSEKNVQSYDGETRARVYILSYMTGLRRKELGTLTPESFDLNAEQPVLEVEAACSKHRRLDVLPLHPDLADMLRDWLKDAAGDERLFPDLEKKKTGKMVQKDLERAGIPYETRDGVADFHAAGRHTHVTELLRTGASLVETKALARHSDIRTTMAYTHIGIDEQAKALARIRWECPGSNSDGISGHLVSVGGTDSVEAPNDTSPVKDRACRQLSPPVTGVQKRRERDSNPRSSLTRTHH